jgi:hypothetical protein
MTHMTESVYPIDATQENLERIAESAPSLDSIADWTGYPRQIQPRSCNPCPDGEQRLMPEIASV